MKCTCTASAFHICSAYAQQALYPSMLRAISAEEMKQFMYVPVRTEEELNVGRIDDDPKILFRFVNILQRHHRVMFRSKISRVLEDVLDHSPVREYKLTHAHFLYSDGAVALALHRKIGLPYIVAVRNTDLHAFMRLRPDLSSMRDDILRHASRVVFLSPAYLEKLTSRLPAFLQDLVTGKAITIPNGLDPEWLNDLNEVVEDRTDFDHTLKLLYVGDFSTNKNISGILSALDILQTQRPTSLTVVGGGRDAGNRVRALLNSYSCKGVSFHGRITNRDRLRLLYRTHDVLVMPSFYETFGMTYIEALSQGLPVVHSVGQGIDGYFAGNTVAAAVNPADAHSIAMGVLSVAGRLPWVRNECLEAARRFDWRLIGESYREIYRGILKR